MNEGDFFIYTDACVLYLNSTKQIIESLKKENLEMWMEKLSHIEKKYTKRDAFILMGADSLFYTNTLNIPLIFKFIKNRNILKNL